MSEALDLAGKRVLVTGASGAFGTAVTAALRDRGARVIGLDLRPGDEVLACDVTDEESVRAAVTDAVERLGGLDVLVNNAGLGGPAPAGSPPDDAVKRMFEVNLFGAWRVSAAAVPELVKSRGRVVFVASRMSFIGLPFGAAYGASKRALTGYADALRAEYGTHLKVTCVHPAFVRTPIHDRAAEEGLSVEGFSREEPLEAVVAAILRACGAARPGRDLPTTRAGAVQLAFARHLPRLVDRVVARRVRRSARSGAFDGAALAVGLRERHGR